MKNKTEKSQVVVQDKTVISLCIFLEMTYTSSVDTQQLELLL